MYTEYQYNQIYVGVEKIAVKFYLIQVVVIKYLLKNFFLCLKKFECIRDTQTNQMMLLFFIVNKTK